MQSKACHVPSTPMRTFGIISARLVACMAAMALSLAFAGAACAAAPMPEQAETTSVAPDKLDRAITTVLERPEYSWRLPRYEEQVTEESSFLTEFDKALSAWFKKGAKAVLRVLEKVFRWLDKMLKKLFRQEHPDKPLDLTWHDSIRFLLFILLALAASIAAILLFRLWKRRKAGKTVTAVAVAAVVDILSEHVEADKLPSDEWMKMAREFLDKGEFRLAIRAMYLACLAHLAYREKLSIARFKSNREYIAELDRRAHDNPDMLDAFRQNVRIVEQVWYGTHAATEQTVDVFTKNENRILNV